MITDAIQEIITRLQAVDEIEHVYNHMPLTPTGALMKDRFVTGGVLNGWTVLRTNAAREDDENNFTTFRHTISVEGRLTYQHAESQQTMDAWIDGILEALSRDDTLNATVDTVISVRLAESKPYLFFNVLCHYARIEVVVHVSKE